MHGIICLVSFFIRCVVLHARFTFGMLATSGADIVSCSCPYNCLASPANFIYGRYRAKFNDQTDTDRYFIDRKKVNPDLFVIELEICTCIYNIVNLLKSYDNIHRMT